MNIACPECSTFYRVNPERVPEDGVAVRCRECGTVFRVDRTHAEMSPGEHATAERVSEPGGAGAPTEPPETRPTGDAGAAESQSSGGGGGAPAFGPQDPETRARRLARALVSDMKVYNLDKWKEATEAGTLRKEFRDEILKSWEEYVEQVGKEMAKGRPYFRNALNDILAQGEQVF